MVPFDYKGFVYSSSLIYPPVDLLLLVSENIQDLGLELPNKAVQLCLVSEVDDIGAVLDYTEFDGDPFLFKFPEGSNYVRVIRFAVFVYQVGANGNYSGIIICEVKQIVELDPFRVNFVIQGYRECVCDADNQNDSN